jgi:hypothetical protein
MPVDEPLAARSHGLTSWVTPGQPFRCSGAEAMPRPP